MRDYLLFFLTFQAVSSADLPTLYEYYTSDGITSRLSTDQSYFTLNGKNITIFSGSIHYFRVPPLYLQDRLRKLRAAGLNVVDTYVPWNLHEPQNGLFEFGSSNTEYHHLADLLDFLTLAQQEDLFVILRVGPYINGNHEWGGLPSWLLNIDQLVIRSANSVFLEQVKKYYNSLLKTIAPYQFTNGGSIIAIQVENEYGAWIENDEEYLDQLVSLIRNNGIVELLFTTDDVDNLEAGSLPELFKTVTYSSDPDAAFKELQRIQPDKPLMMTQVYTGWFDLWTDEHHTISADTFKETLEALLAYSASVNLYMFHGGTNWGFLNGGYVGSENNSQFSAVTTSYDYDAPLTETGDYRVKYYVIRDLIEKYNPIKTKLPDLPEIIKPQIYDSLTIDGQLSLEDIMAQAELMLLTTFDNVAMEFLPMNNGSGQSYGYTVYHSSDLNILANSVLTITGNVRDTVMVLVNGELVSKRLNSSDDFNAFGYWKLTNSSLILTTIDLTKASLDIIIENWGRSCTGDIHYEGKGLYNDVFINDEKLSEWVIFPLQFSRSWVNALKWNPVENGELIKGPALYKATLKFGDYEYQTNDTFIDMSGWNKGIVMANGFNLGRYAFIGPQQTLFLPGVYLHESENQIVIFEHFSPSNQVIFSKDPIFNTP